MSIPRNLINREAFLDRFVIAFGGLAGLAAGIPIIGYAFAPLLQREPEPRRNVRFVYPGRTGGFVGVNSIPVGETREVSYLAPSPLPWAGTTAKQGAWLRRIDQERFTAFSLYCSHLGCPVHWLPKPEIFLCPCHGSVFNTDGTVAGGPAPRPLFRLETRVSNGRVQIKTHALPSAG